MGFCTDDEYWRFLRQCPVFERMLVEDGILLVKYWFSVSDDEQERRFQARLDDPLKRWKLSPMDLESRSRWVDYSRAKDTMFEYTDVPGVAVVRRGSRRQATRPSQLHRAPALTDPVPRRVRAVGEAALAPERRGVRATSARAVPPRPRSRRDARTLTVLRRPPKRACDIERCYSPVRCHMLGWGGAEGAGWGCRRDEAPARAGAPGRPSRGLLRRRAGRGRRCRRTGGAACSWPAPRSVGSAPE